MVTVGFKRKQFPSIQQNSVLVPLPTDTLGDFTNSSAYLDFVPVSNDTAGIVDELATILTAGCLTSENRILIKEVMNNEMNATVALIKAQQLVLSTAEFHASGPIEKASTALDCPYNLTKESFHNETIPDDYKALIFIMLKGEADTHQYEGTQRMQDRGSH